MAVRIHRTTTGPPSDPGLTGEMSRPGGMAALSPRQTEILGLIGIEVWRRRTEKADFPAAHPAETQSHARTGADPEKAGTARSGRWYLVGGETSPVRDVWVFCSGSTRFLDSDPSARRLLEEILQAMGYRIGDVSVFHPGDDRADTDAGSSARHILETHPGKAPKQVIALGRDCSEWARAHLNGVESGGVPDGDVGLLAGEDLESLMADPRNKARLWRKAVASGMSSLGG